MFKELMRAIQAEIFYIRYLDHLRKLNRNVITLDGEEIDCFDIIPDRAELTEAIIIPRRL